MLPSSNAALAPQQAEQHPLPPLSLCAVATESRHLPKVLPVDYCRLLVLGILKHDGAARRLSILQASNHRAATAEHVATPQWRCRFLSSLAAALCPDTCCTFVYCRLLLAIFNNRLSPLSFNAHLLPLSLCIAERMQQKWVFAAAVGMVLCYRRTRASKTLHHLSFGAL